MRSARIRELWNLLAVGAAHRRSASCRVYTARQNEISSTSLIYAAFFLALYVLAHLGAARRAAGRRPVAAAAGGAA